MERKLLFMKLPKTNRLLGLQVRGTIDFFQGSEQLSRVYLVFPRNDPGGRTPEFSIRGDLRNYFFARPQILSIMFWKPHILLFISGANYVAESPCYLFRSCLVSSNYDYPIKNLFKNMIFYSFLGLPIV